MGADDEGVRRQIGAHGCSACASTAFWLITRACLVWMKISSIRRSCLEVLLVSRIFVDGVVTYIYGALDLPAEDDTQRTDMSLLTLERTLETESLLFLTCVPVPFLLSQMCELGRLMLILHFSTMCINISHLQGLVQPPKRLIAFEEVVIPGNVTRTVAATGFYHILGDLESFFSHSLFAA